MPRFGLHTKMGERLVDRILLYRGAEQERAVPDDYRGVYAPATEVLREGEGYGALKGQPRESLCDRCNYIAQTSRRRSILEIGQG